MSLTEIANLTNVTLHDVTMDNVTFVSVITGHSISDVMQSTTASVFATERLLGLVDTATKDMVIEVINCYFLPVVFLFGVCGNIMSFVVLTIHGLNNSTNVLLLGVTVSDFCFLVTMFARKVSCIVSHFDMLTSKKIETALIPNVYMVNRVFNLTTPFLTMLITMERCLAVTAPFKVRSFVTPLRMKLAVIFIFVFCLAFEFPFFLIYEVNWVNATSGDLVPALSGTPFFYGNFDAITAYNNIVLSAIFNYLPMSVVIVCTVVIIATIKKSARWRKDTSQAGEKSEDRRMTKMLLTVVAVYIACYFPRCAVLVANSLAPDTFNSLGGRYGNLFYLMSALQLLLYALNSSTNFVIYMVMSSKFYNTYVRVFLCNKLRQKDNTVKGSSSSGSDKKTGITPIPSQKSGE